jgi:hypothetical protein
MAAEAGKVAGMAGPQMLAGLVFAARRTPIDPGGGHIAR